MRSLLRATILGLFATIAVSTAPASAADSPCEAADAMLGAHQLDLAQRMYAEVYKADATATCARNGLAQIDTLRADANHPVCLEHLARSRAYAS